MRHHFSIAVLPRFALVLAFSYYAAGADFVGNQACASCHAAIYRSFTATPMARGSGRMGTEEPKETFDRAAFRDSKNTFAYRIGQDNRGYFFEFSQPRAPQPGAAPLQGRRPLEYFVGSGAAARSYLFSVDGFLYEAPVSYYRNSGSWNFAPGYASGSLYLTRPVLPGCLQCHSSGVQRIAGTENGYGSPPFLQGGVACERCHGPGSDHIASGAPLVNPAKLPPERRDSICEQCHLSGEIRVPKAGKDDLSFRPGDRLADVLTTFVRGGSAQELRVTSHVENLAASACKRASGEKLWCGSCHDPHTVPASAEKAAYYRAKCLNCHADSDCRAAKASRQANGNDCVSCHMPRNPPSDVEHVVFTDHSIRRRPSSSGRVQSDSPRADAELVPFRGAPAGARDLGLAYAMAGLRENDRAYLDRAFQVLKEAVAAGSRDSVALAYLAQFYRDRKDDAHALPLYEESWRMDPSQPAVAAAIGAYWMQLGNRDQAILYWNHALEMNPALLLVRVNLAEALLRAGRRSEAQATLRKGLELDPTFQPARDLLDDIGK